MEELNLSNKHFQRIRLAGPWEGTDVCLIGPIRRKI